MIIKSPFNFIQVSNRVVFPDWAYKISQDVPFSDGVSGIIKLTITAESPIYIKNGQQHKDKDNENTDYSFSHVGTAKGNLYFIPGTSIKGEVRNVMEIMSYGKMCVDERAQFARRDLNNEDVYPLLKKQRQEHCGWLRLKDEGYEIEDCGRFWRISHDEIDRFLGSPVMRRNFSEAIAGTLKDEHKTATFKYSLIDDESLLEGRTFEEIGKNKQDDKLVEYSTGGDLRGTIVFTGQPSSWKEPRGPKAGKYYEFVFPEKVRGTRSISEEDFEHYAFIYRDSEDWGRIKRLLDASEQGGRGVPVFFIPKGSDGVEHFGMAYLYKMPYDHSVFESLPIDHQAKDKHDLAECIFGYTSKEDSLKGRVQFGHAFATEAKPLGKRIRLVLGSPKASYYPLYVKQDGKKGITNSYKTYDQGTPSGWKRYYVRRDTNSVKCTESTVDTFMEPLDKGATFQGNVTFHNLRQVELGALLSALTFHATPKCRHQLGMAKPYGFGKCRYDIELIITASNEDEQPKSENYYMARFEDFMSQHINQWIQQPQIKDLFGMAGNNVSNGGPFDYMTMTNDRKTNEFIKAKDNNEYLQSPTVLLPQIITPESLCNTPEYKAEQDIMKKREKEKQAEIERRRKQQVLRNFKEEKEQIIDQASTDKGFLNNLKAELSNMLTDDVEMQAIIKDLIEKIGRKANEIEQSHKTEGFQGAFKTEIKDYKMFETRVKAGLRNTPLDQLTKEDIDFGTAKLQEAFDNDSKKLPKNWEVTTGSYFKKCVKIVGIKIATEWFKNLKR